MSVMQQESQRNSSSLCRKRKGDEQFREQREGVLHLWTMGSFFPFSGLRDIADGEPLPTPKKMM